MGMIHSEIDSEFNSVKKILNLNWRLTTVEEMQRFGAKVHELVRKSYTYKFLMKEILGTEKKYILICVFGITILSKIIK